MDSLTTFILLWGVWLIIPIIVDGTDALVRLVIVWTHKPSDAPDHLGDEALPTMSVIVPAHNEAQVIDRCLMSLMAQDYPHEKLEIIVVDDGSTDGTADRVEERITSNGAGAADEPIGSIRVKGEPIRVGPYRGELTLIKNGHGGKSHALNAGIERSRGQLVVNIDSDVVLAPDAIRSIAEAFAWDPDLGAATGNIEVDWDVLESRDDEGRLIVDENGAIVPRDLKFGERWLAKWQFLEYLSSFNLGRTAQAETGTLYTLAGACSAFRREVLMKGRLYSNRTVSEDTDLTFDLQRQRVKIGFVREARVFLEPVVSWDRLYSQRVRWARGQMEVCGLNEDMVGGGKFGALSRLALPQMLLYDHTLGFPRLIWTFLILLFPLFGYSWALIAKALIAMYILYLLIEIVNALACNAVADEDSRHRLEQSGLALLGLPAYRFAVFHFRFSGFLTTFKEDQQWTTPGPVDQTKVNLRAMRMRSIEFAAGFMAVGGVALVRSLRLLQAALAPLLLTIVFAVISSMDQFKRGQ